MTANGSDSMESSDISTLRGADPDLVRSAIERADPFPGTAGFAGAVDDRLVRDVLGRVPLFVDRADAASDPGWAFSPVDLERPASFPAGAVADLDDPEALANPELVWALPDPEASSVRSASPADGGVDRDAALDRLDGAIRSAVDEAAGADLAVAFSGGVDSALLAALLDAPLYVVGFPDGHDLEAARSAADAMGRADDLRVETLDLERLERAVPTVARATGRTNAMDVSIALPLYLTAERAAADGFDRLLVGQGADELFGGYEKVARLDHRVAADTVRGAVREVIAGLPDQVERDVLAVEAGGVEPVAPYLHDDVVRLALRLPEDLLVADGCRKRALRLVAESHLPPSVARREKKAAQYGSLVSRELDRLARRAGYKRRMDDHVSRYVRSRLE